MNWQHTLPQIIAEAKCEVALDPQAEDLLTRLLTEPARRLTVADIKAHPFFKGVPWDNLRNTVAPIIPVIKVG